VFPFLPEKLGKSGLCDDGGRSCLAHYWGVARCVSDLLRAIAAPRIFPGFVRRMVPIRAGFGLDLRRIFGKKSLVLLSLGRIAQRESVPFTRERSKVRSLVRPPEKP
jgi:hypothetical protein